jgi:hypothetical protein
VFSARDAVIGATPASAATSRNVVPPLLRRLRRGGGVMRSFLFAGLSSMLRF